MDTADAAWTADELEMVQLRLRNLVLELRLRLQSSVPPPQEGGDAADHAEWSAQAELDSMASQRDHVLLQQTEHVLERIAHGVYDRCELCGGTIAKERLHAHPQATLCLSCIHDEVRTPL